MRTIRRLALATTVMCGLLAAGTAASAATVSPPIRWTGKIATASGSTSTGGAGWDAKTGAVRLTVTTGSLAYGYCVTVYFDWSSTSHHDARALRDCRAHDTATYTFSDSSPTNLRGTLSKLGVCYGPADKRGWCVTGVGTHFIYMDWTPWPDTTRTTPCDLSWVRRNASGTVSAFLDPHPLLGRLTSTGHC